MSLDSHQSVRLVCNAWTFRSILWMSCEKQEYLANIFAPRAHPIYIAHHLSLRSTNELHSIISSLPTYITAFCCSLHLLSQHSAAPNIYRSSLVLRSRSLRSHKCTIRYAHSRTKSNYHSILLLYNQGTFI